MAEKDSRGKFTMREVMPVMFSQFEGSDEPAFRMFLSRIDAYNDAHTRHSPPSGALGPTYRPRSNRNEPICFSPHLYRARNLVERFFNKIKSRQSH